MAALASFAPDARGKSSKRLRTGGLIALAAAAPHVAAAATFEIGDSLFEFSEVVYSATAISNRFPTNDLRIENQVETTEFVSLGMVEPTPAAERLLNESSAFSRFVEPFNGNPQAFSSARMEPDGDGDIGVSGFVNTIGRLRALANYNYAITNLESSPMNLNVDYEVPEIELALIGTEFQEGPRLSLATFDSILTGVDSDILQLAYANARLNFEITNADGDTVTTGNLYDFAALLSKNSRVIGDPFGFSPEASTDLQALVADGVSEEFSISENAFGAFDIARLAYGPIEGRAGLPAIPAGGSVELDLLLEAIVWAPSGQAVENGGEARIGDPFTLSPNSSAFSVSLADETVAPAPVPVPPSLALAIGSLLSFAALGRFARRRELARAEKCVRAHV
ncbi:MAG: hypothetical protein AAGF90_00185 [Pseudomonadota bacterium]